MRHLILGRSLLRSSAFSSPKCCLWWASRYIILPSSVVPVHGYFSSGFMMVSRVWSLSQFWILSHTSLWYSSIFCFDGRSSVGISPESGSMAKCFFQICPVGVSIV